MPGMDEATRAVIFIMPSNWMPTCVSIDHVPAVMPPAVWTRSGAVSSKTGCGALDFHTSGSPPAFASISTGPASMSAPFETSADGQPRSSMSMRRSERNTLRCPSLLAEVLSGSNPDSTSPSCMPTFDPSQGGIGRCRVIDCSSMTVPAASRNRKPSTCWP